MLHAAWIESVFIQCSPPNSLNSPAPCWAPIIRNLEGSRRPLVSLEFLSLMWAGLIRIIRTMAEARSVNWKTMKKKNHSSFFIQMLTVYAMMPKPKMLSLMRWRIRNSPFVLWKEPKISRGSLQDCRKDRTLCEEGQGWVRIQANGPDNLFQFHCDS